MSATHFSGPIVSTNGFKPGTSSVALTQVLNGTVAVNPTSLLTLTSQDVTVTITGVATGDVVIMNPPSTLESSLSFTGCYVSAADTVKVRITNHSSGTVDGASATFTYAVLRFA
jgi:hypothetical protein